MESSILLARIIGPLFVVIAFGAFFNKDFYRTLIKDVARSPVLIYLTGTLAFVIGVAIVLFHNIWVMDWRVIITLLGWMSILKGVMRIVFPRWVMKVIKSNWQEGAAEPASLIFIAGIGLLLSVMGYWPV